MDNLDNVLFKLKKVKKFLKGWGFNKAGNAKKRKREINEEIMNLKMMEELGPLTEDQIKLRNSLKAELWKILDHEELYWHKRCHET
jgi:hypothetical protein